MVIFLMPALIRYHCMIRPNGDLRRDATATVTWQPYREPMRVTLLRTGIIAAVGGAAITLLWHGGLVRWPAATLSVLWISFGGHWVEVAFLNVLRPWLPSARWVQTSARIAVWFIGGIVLFTAMALTATSAGLHPDRWPDWWTGGLGFIGVELIAHLSLVATHRPSFYNGRG